MKEYFAARPKHFPGSKLVCWWRTDCSGGPEQLPNDTNVKTAAILLIDSAFLEAGAHGTGMQGSQPAFIVFTSTPTLLTSISTVSPGFIHTGGLRRAPTPPGVPVTMTSPGSSVVKVEM